MKRVYRSTQNSIVAGICGGLGEYYHVDPTLIRLGYLFLTAFTGVVPGLIAYIIAMFIVPEREHMDYRATADSSGA